MTGQLRGTRHLRALPAHYRGVTFRSRTEARWAVFLDSLGVPWQYEPEGYPLREGWYLPDFLLSGPDGPWAYLEVKPELPTDQERTRAELLAWGDPAGWTWSDGEPAPGTFPPGVSQDAAWRFAGVGGLVAAARLPVYIAWGYPQGDRPDYSGTYAGGAMTVPGDCDYAFAVCPTCGRVGIAFQEHGERVCPDHADRHEVVAGNDPRLRQAYRAGWAARFGL